MMHYAILAIAPALILAAAPDKAAQKYAGGYDGGQTEIAAGLELSKDGRFRYMMSYGAADEVAAGRWTLAGDTIVLTIEQFESSDPGQKSLGTTILNIDDGELLLPRYDRLLRFRKQ